MSREQTLTAPAQPQAKTACYHCGDPLGAAPVVENDKAFCCNGCRSVYDLLAENNLCYYYDIDDKAGRAVKDAPPAEDALAYLDDPDLVRQLADFYSPEQTTVTFSIPAIHCASCIWLLENLYKLDKGVTASLVNFPKKEVTVTYRNAETSLRKVVAVLNKIGYPPALSLSQTKANKNAPSPLRRLVLQMGVAGFCFGNIMILSFPDYLAAGQVSPEFERLFGYMSLILALPVLFFSAQDYFKGAYNGLRARQLPIELPLAIGMAAMFFQSSYDILTHTGAGYLDSLGGLTFFLLVGKFFQQKTYSFLSFERDYSAYFPLSANKVVDDKEISVPIIKLEAGDKLAVRHGELIPADSVLVSPEARIDFSFLTGEAEPARKRAGEMLYAGGRNAGGRIEVLVNKKVSQSGLTRLWNHPAFQKDRSQPVMSQIVNRLSWFFTPAALVIAFSALAYWLVVDPSKAMHAFTTVLIIACPCALALASPFAFGHVARIFGNYGFFLKHAETVERLANLDTLAFDKTGTLTRERGGQTVFETPFAETVERPLLPLAKSAAMQSAHPLSRAIVEYLSDSETFPVTEWKETAGQGIEAVIEGKRVKLGSAAFVGVAPTKAKEGSAAYLSIDGSYCGVFRLKSKYRENIEETLMELGADYDLRLLSGDSETEAPRWAAYFEGDKMAFNQQPEDKLTNIEKLQAETRKVAMIGDGLNDAGALRQANVGIAVTEHTARFTPASDGILAANALPLLPRFLAVARGSIGVVKLCFALSLIYNVVGITYAVQGEFDPVVAAIIMPFSSIGVITVATLGTFRLVKKHGFHPFKKLDEGEVFGG